MKSPEESYLPFHIEDFADDSANLDVVSFRSQHGNAFLIYYGSVKAWRARTGEAITDFEDEPTTEVSPLSQPGAEILVFPIRHTGRSIAGNLITLGRTRNNDIVIFDASISRVHAYFREDTDDRFFVQDAGSMNGTFLGDKRLAPKGDAMEVGPWSRVRFGSIETVFHSATELYGMAKR